MAPSPAAPQPSASAHNATETWLLLEQLVARHRLAWRQHILTRITMPFNRFYALASIAARPGTNSELADRLGLDAPGASTVVRDLARHGLIHRSPDPQDKRRKIISLTPAGSAAMADVRSAPLSFTPFRNLTDAERHTLHELLLKASADETE